MKINASSRAEFNPVTVEITLEEQCEVDALYALFNHISVTDVVKEYGLDDQAVRSAVFPHIVRSQADSIHVRLNEAFGVT